MEHRLLLLLLAALVLVSAHFIMPHVVFWLRVKSGVVGKRRPSDIGIPPSILGNFERILATVVVAADVPNAGALLGGWLVAKLAASWQRFSVNNDEKGRQIRAGTQAALMAGVISIAFGVIAGLCIRCAIK